MMEQTQKISAERLAEKLHHAEVALGAFQNMMSPKSRIWEEDVALLCELRALRASHKRLVEALEELVSFAAYSGDMRGAANEHGRAALADARKLEGK